MAQGASLRSVLRQLEERQLIGNARHLEWYLRCCRPGTSLAGCGHQGRSLPHRPRPAATDHPAATGRGPRDARKHHHRRRAGRSRRCARRWRAGRACRHVLRNLSDAQIMQELGAPELAAEGRFAPDTYSFAPGSTSDLQILRLAFEAQQQHTAGGLEQPRQPDLPFANVRRGAGTGLHRREGNRPGQRAGTGGRRLHQSSAHRHAPAVRSFGDLRHPQLRRQHPQERPASRQALQHLHARRAAAHAHRTAGPRGHHRHAASGKDRRAVLRGHRRWQRRALFRRHRGRAQPQRPALPRTAARGTARFRWQPNDAQPAGDPPP